MIETPDDWVQPGDPRFAKLYPEAAKRHESLMAEIREQRERKRIDLELKKEAYAKRNPHTVTLKKKLLKDLAREHPTVLDEEEFE